jgi:hypothetical protein
MFSVQDKEVGRTCNTNGEKNAYWLLIGKAEGKYHYKGQSVGG